MTTETIHEEVRAHYAAAAIQAAEGSLLLIAEPGHRPGALLRA